MFMIKTCRSARTKAKRRLFSSLPSSEYLSGGWRIWSLTLTLCTFLPALSLVLCFTCECEVRQKSQVLQRKVPVMHPKVLMISCPWGPLHTLAMEASWCKWWARRDESSSTHSLRLCCDGGAQSLDAEGTAEDRRHSEVWLIFFFPPDCFHTPHHASAAVCEVHGKPDSGTDPAGQWLCGRSVRSWRQGVLRRGET